MILIDNKQIIVYQFCKLKLKGKEYKCALGKKGVTRDKKEGDLATPVGCFLIREVFYRKDRLGEQTFSFKTNVISENDAWCDDVDNKRYNKHIILADSEVSNEKLWREDDVYDVVAVLGHNDNPPVPGKGSAIFMHVACEGYIKTAGCIALSQKDLLEVLKSADPKTKVCVMGQECIQK